MRNGAVRRLSWFVPFAILPVLAGFFATFALWRDPHGNLVTGLETGWGDMQFHLRAVTFFAEQGGWPRESFLLMGEPVGYPFAADWISGALWRAGLPLELAVGLPTVLLVVLFLTLFQWVVWHFSHSRSAAVLSSLLFMGFGGLSGFFLLPKLFGGESIWWEALRDLPQSVTAWHDQKMVILNPFVMVLHQRGGLLGFPLLLLLCIATRTFFQRGSFERAALILLGILFLAFVHPFTAIAWLLIFPSWAFWAYRLHAPRLEKATLVGIGLVLLFGTVETFLIVRSFQPGVGASFLHWQPGWLAGLFEWPVFWLKNLGGFLLLAPFAYFYARRHVPQLVPLLLAALTPFLVGNLLTLTPWDWDNTKLFAPTWLFFSVAIGILVSHWWGRFPRHRFLVGAGVVVLLLSGGLEVGRLLTYASRPLVLLSAEQEQLAGEVRRQTRPEEVVLTAPSFHAPVFALAGRKSLAAYDGWMWSQGWQGRYEQRVQDMTTIYRGGPEAEKLLGHYGVRAVALGPAERDLGSDEKWFQERFPLLAWSSEIRVYDTRSLAPDS